jgi:DNA-binding CsgD family transcriptional regulator
MKEHSGANIGLVLMDAAHQVSYANTEAVRILSYPQRSNAPGPVDLSERIRDTGLLDGTLSQPKTAVEFRSGERRYVCRVVALEAGKPWPIALILERQDRRPFDRQAASLFGLSPRERQALEGLVRGMTNKEIAARMEISSNTVKVYLRSIMTKMAVSTRAAIVARTLGTLGAPGTSHVSELAQSRRRRIPPASLSRPAIGLYKQTRREA